MRLNKNNYLIYFLLLTNLFCFSQTSPKSDAKSDKVEDLEEVIITATRTKRQLSSLPLPVTIITKKEIKAGNYLRLKNVINEQTGLVTIPDYGGGEGVQLQGLDSEYTLILIDGAPVIGRKAGTLDLSRLSVGNIKQIEVVKGASSCLYGNEALGGVINIITDQPKDNIETAIDYRISDYNTHDTNVNLGWNKKKISVSGFINRYSSNGYDLDKTTIAKTVAPFINYTLNTKIDYAVSKKSNVLASARYFTEEQSYVVNENLNGNGKANELNGQLKYTHAIEDKWKMYVDIYATSYRTTSHIDSLSGNELERSFFNQALVRPELRTTYNFSKKTNAIIGFGVNHERLNRTSFAAKPVFNTPYAYAQFDATIINKVNVIIGARYDNHSKYQSQFSPKTAFRLEINDKLSLKSSVGYGFKAPDFRQLYFDFTNSTVGYTVLGYNAVITQLEKMEVLGQISSIKVPSSEFVNGLKPESSLSMNTGVDFKPTSTLKISVNYFNNKISNLIDTQVIASKRNGQNVFSYYNVNTVETQGLECNAKWKPTSNFYVSGGYQLLYAKDKVAQEAFYKGKIYARKTISSPSFVLKETEYFGLYNRSRHMGNIKFYYNYIKWGLNASLRGVYRSKYGLYDTNGNSYLDSYDTFVKGYSVWNTSLNKTLFKNYTVGIGMDNAFGYKDPKNITNLPGRIVYGKLNISI